MTFTLPFPQPVMIELAAVLGGLTVIAYILKMRRRRHEVPFSKLWQRVLRDKESSSLWRRLKRLISLLVQLAFLALVLIAALNPTSGAAATSGKNVVIIVDASASMKALDDGPGKPARIEQAKDAARKLLHDLGGADVAMIERMDGQTTALSRFESDMPHLIHVVDGIQATDTPADVHRALQAAADALRGRRDPLIVIIGDGAYPEDALKQVRWAAAAPATKATAPAPTTKLGEVDLTGINVSFIGVGKEAKNVGIVAFNVRRYLANKLSYEVLVELQNFGTEPELERLTLFAGDEAISVKTITVAPGPAHQEIYPDLGGGDDRALRAHLERVDANGTLLPPDAFPLDDTAWALLPERKKERVLLVTPDNLYLEAALLLDPNITIDKEKPEGYAKDLAAGKLAGYDVTVFDGFTPDGPPPSAGAIYFHPTGDKSPFTTRGEINRPFITELNPDHPVTRWVTLTDVNIDKANVFTPADNDTVLARSIRDPIIIAGKRDGKKVIAFGFGLDGTDLMLRVAFPVLLVNAMDWFAGDDAELLTTYRTGRVWSIPVDSQEKLREVTVRGPSGKTTAPVQAGRAHFYGQYAGIYEVQTADGSVGVAANLADPQESNIKPSATLTLGDRLLPAPPAGSHTVSRSIWIYLALGALLLSMVEWLTYNRRWTV